MNSISLVFQDDVHRDDLDLLERIPGCLGASAYRNTVNVYFRDADRATLLAVTLAARRIASANGGARPFLYGGAFPAEEAVT
jgi:hypothetical protein